MMRVDWPVPVTLHLHPDVTDRRASQLRRSGDGSVQLLLGADVGVHVWRQDATGPVSSRAGEVLSGVTAIELDDPSEIDDDTVASADGVFGEPPTSPLTRTGNDVDDTILGQPGVPRGDAEDADAAADTVIGAGRRRPETRTPARASLATPILPPPLPAIPRLPESAHAEGAHSGSARAASAHAAAEASPADDRRTRVEPPDTSGRAGAENAVSLPDGRLVALDRPVYVGRSPRSPRITSGLVPELVAVASPRREVSATHLEIVQEGRAVVVRDLGSTNGTRVRVPGAAPSLLSPGASRVVAAGTLLDLGDDIVLEIVARIDGES
jgi:hypothetical protein